MAENSESELADLRLALRNAEREALEGLRIANACTGDIANYAYSAFSTALDTYRAAIEKIAR